MIEIYGAPWCGYCKEALNLAEQQESHETRYYNIEVGRNKEMLLNRLPEKPKTIPQIFVDNEHIGGYDELVEYLGEENNA